MLGDKNLTVNIAAKDLSIAKKFYEEILGLKQVGAEGMISILLWKKAMRSLMRLEKLLQLNNYSIE